MFRHLRLVTLALILALTMSAVAASGQTPPPTSIKFKNWTVYTFDGKRHAVKPGRTYKHCPTARASAWKVRAQVTYENAVVGETYTTTWSRGSQTLLSTPHQWTKTNGPLGVSLRRNSGIGTGRFRLKITQADGKVLGTNSVGVAQRRKCK